MLRGMRAPVVAIWTACALLAACAPESQTYHARGTVVGVEPTARQLRIDHETIPDFMPAMTMNFDVADDVPLDEVEPGVPVEFTLERRGSLLRVTELRVLGAAPISLPPAGQSGTWGIEPAEEVAPDFALVDQDGQPRELGELRGRAVVLDFIFTRCPGPCPILTSTHVALQRALPAELAERTWFVSVTLDPEHDTPERMRDYAVARGADLERWWFLTGEPESVAEVVRLYHVGATRRSDGELDHLVVTYLIGPDGGIAERYLGSEVPPEAILADLERLLG
jgi:protein SCO1/2